MQGAARDTHTTTRLLAHLERGVTGRLSVGEGTSEVSVYLLNGEIVAARRLDDDRHLIRRLWAGQVIDIARVASLEAMAELGESVFGVLLEEIEPDLMEAILFERFRDNLATFLGDPEEPRFTEMSAVFVDNIQMGHDSLRLAADCAHLWQRAAMVDPEMGIVPSHPEDAAGEQVLVMEALGTGRTVRAVLDDVALEPIWARAMIAGMLDTGIVASSEIDPPDVSPDDATYEPSVDPTVPEVPSPLDYDATEIIEGALPRYIRADGPTLETEIVESPRKKARKLGEVIAEKKSKPDEPVLPKKGRRGKGKTREEQAFPEIEPDADEFEEDEPTVDASRPVKVPLITDSISPDVEEPTVEEAAGEEEAPFGEFEDVDEADMPSGGQGTLDLDALFRTGDAGFGDDELDLEAFADHDSARGAEAEGVFKTEEHNLDRIEVRPLDAGPTSADEAESDDLEVDEELIEADEAPHALFSGKLLSEDEALKKIAVANQAVGEVIAAFDASEGVGRGRATLQIILEGSPQKFAVLFQGIRLADDEVPANALLRNLHERPQTEHRQLLNQGLVDLIERALSLAMDEITDDAAIDTLLERTAGYRQRIGL